jgi:hypothetical protein
MGVLPTIERGRTALVLIRWRWLLTWMLKEVIFVTLRSWRKAFFLVPEDRIPELISLPNCARIS